MKTSTRVLTALLACSALLLPATPAIAAPVAPIDWRPCPERPEVDCGTLTLPIDHRNPSGAKFGLAVARRKATDPASRIGVLVVNPGGPGGSGVDFTLGGDRIFSPELNRRFDLVGFDPRGVRRTQPVTCATDLLTRQRALIYPRDRTEFEQFAALNKELRADCRARTGPLYDHLSTAEVAQDVDALRRALGERQISWFGMSYGTTMGQHYAERYGDKIRAMVLDSNVDHSIGLREHTESSARGAEDMFAEWVRWNQRNPAAPLHGKDIERIWQDLMARAERGELPDPDQPGATLTPEAMGASVTGMGYGPDFRRFSRRIAKMHAAATEPRTAAAAQPETTEDPLPAIFCSDFDFRISSYAQYRALKNLANRVSPHTRGNSLAHYQAMSCTGFPAAANPQRPLRIPGAPKILLTNAVHDPSTVYDWARTVHRQARGRTALLTYEGWGHGVYSRSECTQGRTDDYLITLALPAEGTRCAAVEPPA